MEAIFLPISENLILFFFFSPFGGLAELRSIPGIIFCSDPIGSGCLSLPRARATGGDDAELVMLGWFLTFGSL
jgi:hypothetical protein